MQEPSNSLDFASDSASVFARDIIEGNFAHAYCLLTRGLRERLSFEEFCGTIGDAIEDTPPPAAFRCLPLFTDYREWREYAGAIGSDEISAGNFVCWTKIRFLPERIDPIYYCCFDMWSAFVHEEGQDKIAFFEVMEPEH